MITIRVIPITIAMIKLNRIHWKKNIFPWHYCVSVTSSLEWMHGMWHFVSGFPSCIFCSLVKPSIPLLLLPLLMLMLLLLVISAASPSVLHIYFKIQIDAVLEWKISKERPSDFSFLVRKLPHAKVIGSILKEKEERRDVKIQYINMFYFHVFVRCVRHSLICFLFSPGTKSSRGSNTGTSNSSSVHSYWNNIDSSSKDKKSKT